MSKALDNFSWAALSTKGTVKSSYEIAMRAIADGIPGDFVECGVFAGAQCAAMATAILEARDKWAMMENPEYVLNERRVHLFDSFTGIPAAGLHDRELLEHGHKPGVSACSLAQVQKYMKDWGIPHELLVYHRGLFEETIPYSLTTQVPPCRLERIAVLRIDCDLYESTRFVMEQLYPLLSPGGWCIVDDYGLSGARKAVNEFMGGGWPPIYFQKAES